MLGAQFFRQRPTGNYIDDFCTRSVELIIENTIEAKTVPVQHGQLIELC